MNDRESRQDKSGKVAKYKKDCKTHGGNKYITSFLILVILSDDGRPSYLCYDFFENHTSFRQVFIYNFLRFIIHFLILGFSLSAFAATGSRIYLSAEAKGGLGSAGSGDGEVIESRNLYTYGAQLILGYTLSNFLVGASAEYNIWKQKTKPSKVDDTNMSGRQLNFSPVLGLGLGKFLLQARPQLFSKITLDKKNPSDQEVVFTSPSSQSYSVQLNYKLAGSSYIGVEYSNVTYTKTELDGEENKLDSDARPTFSSYGLVYGWMF